MRQAENIVEIEGTLSEINLAYGSFVKQGKTVENISGSIKVRVVQPINGEMTTLEIPVHMFAPKFTNAGAANPAYESIERVMKEFVSIAAAGEEGADRVKIKSGNVGMNEYWSTETNFVSYPRIHASFVTKVKKTEDSEDKAILKIEAMVAQRAFELDKDGVETGRYKVQGIVPQYGGKVDVVEFIANSPSVIDAVSSYWTEKDTVKISCRLNFTSKKETTVIDEGGFGEPMKRESTVNVSELIIAGGSQTPLEGEFAFDYAEISSALTDRKNRLDANKEKQISKTKQKTAPGPNPVPMAGGDVLNDLGF